jgi:hypothetical protein
MKLIIGMLLLSLGAAGMEPAGLWASPTGTELLEGQAITTNVYRIEQDRVLVIPALETINGFSFNEGRAEVYLADERYIDQRMHTRRNEQGIEKNFCATRYGRSYREADEVVVHIRTFEREVMIDCPLRKSIRHRGQPDFPVSQTIIRFVADQTGAVSVSRTYIHRTDEQTRPRSFSPLVRLD